MKELNVMEAIIGNARPMETLIAYQKDSVVSKALIDKKTGTVTLFAFDKGQGLSEHTVPFDAFVYIIDGEAEIVIDKEVKQAKKGDIIIMPADKPHFVKAVERFKMLLVMIRGGSNGDVLQAM
jgi:quercetin dioxygenase-like cupin family protein